MNLYCTESSREAYWIQNHRDTIGFILSNEICILKENKKSIAEFYIQPKYRRMGYGSKSINKILNKPFKWEIAVLDSNKTAYQFWVKVLDIFSCNNFKETYVQTNEWKGSIFSVKN